MPYNKSMLYYAVLMIYHVWRQIQANYINLCTLSDNIATRSHFMLELLNTYNLQI